MPCSCQRRGEKVVKEKRIKTATHYEILYEGCNFNSGNYLFTTDTK